MNHEKSNNPFRTGYVPNADQNFMQQQTYSPPSGHPPQNSYYPELPPPAYDTAPNIGARTPELDVKSERTSAPYDYQTRREAIDRPSGYVSAQSSRGDFAEPDMYSQYTSLPPPASTSRNRSPTTYLISYSTSLGDGFPVVPPPSLMQPHPFASHDVGEADWSMFLGELKQSATVSGGEKLAAKGAGLVVPSIVGGMIVSRAVKMAMQYNKTNSVGELVDAWNQSYFHPRGLDVILAKGQDRLDSGHSSIPGLDPQIEQMAASLALSSASSDHLSYREDKKERRRERRERKREDRLRAFGIGGDANRYRLFVVGL